MSVQYLPGEREAIRDVIAAGHRYGFGNLIAHLKEEWSRTLREGGLDQKTSDLHAGQVCVYCDTDFRTGKKV